MRRLYEQADLKPAAIITHLAALGHAVTINQINAWTQYRTRAHLVPKAGAEPYIK